MTTGPTGVACADCGKEVGWNLLAKVASECQASGKPATAETVRSAILYGLVEMRHPSCAFDKGGEAE